MSESRRFEASHPWINFSIDTNTFDYELWMLLGKAQAQCDFISGVPLRPDTARELHKVYLYKGALATTAIEGNTLTDEEARDYLEGKLELPPSKEYLGREIDNIVAAFNRIMELIEQEPEKGCDLSLDNIKIFNEMVLKDLDLMEDVAPGEIRGHSVLVGRYRGAPAEDCEYLIERLCQWLNDRNFTLGKRYTVASGILKAILAHLYFAWIHPFGDGNGRTARLVELHILLNAGVPSPAAHLLSNHYNLSRSEYYRQLEYSSKKNTVAEFVKYAVQGLVDGLKEQMQALREQTKQVAWENYVHDLFKQKNSKAQIRRRHLAIDLSRAHKPVPLTDLRLLTPRLAAEYSQKNSKVIYKDYKALLELDLIRIADGGIVANIELIQAFLPFCKNNG